MVGTRSLSSGARSRDPLALPTLQIFGYHASMHGRLRWLRESTISKFRRQGQPDRERFGWMNMAVGYSVDRLARQAR